MESGELFSSAYKGSKDFNQWNVKTANATGFGAAADDYAERGIDLNEQLVRNKPLQKMATCKLFLPAA